MLLPSLIDSGPSAAPSQVWAWGGQAAEHIYRLVGVSAPPELLQKLTL